MAIEIGPGLGIKWIGQLLAMLRDIRSSKKDAIRKATQLVAGIDPFWLAARYIEPNVQVINPADEDENSPFLSTRISHFHAWLNIFLQKPYPRKDGRHVLFLLADAGMGKTSALVMLYLSQMGAFWPRSVKFELFKIDSNLVQELKELKDEATTVLLLDALDEDRTALGSIEGRIKEILRVTRSFRQVIITCRTQFFPLPDAKDAVQATYLSKGVFEIGGYVCQILHLSPFDDRKVYEYLEKIYTPGSQEFDRAATIAESIENLRIRPLILSYIEDLLGEFDLRVVSIVRIYERLVQKWIEREIRKLDELGVTVQPSQIHEICEDLAYSMFLSGDDALSGAEIEKRLSPSALKILEPINIGGRSLLNRMSNGDYRFAHQTIKEYLIFKKATMLDGPLSPPPRSDMINSFLRCYLSEASVGAPTLETLKHSLYRLDLRKINLDSTNLAGANLEGSILAGVSLKKSNLERASLRKCNLSSANLQGASLTRADMAEASLTGANCSHGDLQDASLYKATAFKANFSAADCTRTNFGRALMGDCNFRSSVLTGALFQGACLERSDFKTANLVDSKCREANFKGTLLIDANCTNVDFRDANLQFVDFLAARLKNAELHGTDLSHSKNLSQKQVEGAAGSISTLLPPSIERPDAWARTASEDLDRDGPLTSFE